MATFACIKCKEIFQQDSYMRTVRPPGARKGPMKEVFIAVGPQMICPTCAIKYRAQLPVSEVEDLKRTEQGRQKLAVRARLSDEEYRKRMEELYGPR